MEGTSRILIAKEEWEKKLSDSNIRKQDMNKLVMEFFLSEGYELAAKAFHQESGTEFGIVLETISTRAAIRQAIHSLDLENALEILGLYFPEVLEKNPFVLFHIQRQRFIELVRSGNELEALKFCREYFSPLSEKNPDLKEEVKMVLSLLAFSNYFSCPARHLLDGSMILMLANTVNEAILSSQSHGDRRDPKLLYFIKQLLCVQNSLLRLADFPFMDVLSCSFRDPFTGAMDTD